GRRHSLRTGPRVLPRRRRAGNNREAGIAVRLPTCQAARSRNLTSVRHSAIMTLRNSLFLLIILQEQPVMDTVMDTTPLNDAAGVSAAAPRWTVTAIEALFALPFNDLLFRAQQVHREHFNPNAVQLSTLLSIKTGGCSEDCGYCPQLARYHTGVENQDTLSVEEVVAAARLAREKGATRFCMGAAWRGPKQRDLDK